MPRCVPVVVLTIVPTVVLTWGFESHGGELHPYAEPWQLRFVETIVATEGAFAGLRRDGLVATWWSAVRADVRAGSREPTHSHRDRSVMPCGRVKS